MKQQKFFKGDVVLAKYGLDRQKLVGFVHKVQYANNGYYLYELTMTWPHRFSDSITLMENEIISKLVAQDQWEK